VGVTERTTHKIISDLDTEGYITRRKSGRRNLYEVDPALPLRHHTKQDVMVEDLLHVLSTQGTKELRESAETMSKA
jgi:Mn-dependent DtxR family transcriptional regulator